MERTSICVACEYYGAAELSLSVDPGGRSSDEADALCGRHRARMTEGYCVLCGRRAPWVSPWPGSCIGSCEPCFRAAFGDGHAEEVARRLVESRGVRAERGRPRGFDRTGVR
jgi:hypothetical protein